MRKLLDANARPSLPSYDDALLLDPTYKTVVQTFSASDGHSAFIESLASAWTKLANADMFDGPYGSTCDVSSSTSNMVTPATAPASSSAAGSPLMLGVAFAVGILVGGTTLAKRWAKMEKAKAVAPTMQ